MSAPYGRISALDLVTAGKRPDDIALAEGVQQPFERGQGNGMPVHFLRVVRLQAEIGGGERRGRAAYGQHRSAHGRYVRQQSVDAGGRLRQG